MREQIGEHQGHPLYFEGISYSCPDFRMFGYSSELSLRRAIGRANKKREREESRRRRIEGLVRNWNILKGKVCPQCGCGIHRNLSLTGWWQCNASGVEQYRVGDGIGKPHCDFQMFFDPSEQERQQLIETGIISL